MTSEPWRGSIPKRMRHAQVGRLQESTSSAKTESSLDIHNLRRWTGAMLNGLRLSEPFLSVTFLVLTAIGVCAAMTSSSPPTQGEPTQSPDALAESLEKAISEGKTAKAHDLLLQVLKHPHLTSELLLRVGSNSPSMNCMTMLPGPSSAAFRSTPRFSRLITTSH